MTTHAERRMRFTRQQKTRYAPKGKDFCRWCRREVHVGDRVVVKWNGVNRHVYHEPCYGRKVITLER